MQRINQFLIKSLHLKPEETTKFLLLFFHSFFVGLFIAFYFVQANSVFIKNYGSGELPLAYIIAGIVGYLSTMVYSMLQKKIKSKFLFLGAIAFMLAIAVISRAAMPFVSEKHLSYFVFIWAWPFISLAGIEAGGLAISLLNLIQIKRLFGLINMGGVIASIIGYLVIPALNSVVGTTYNLLFFGMIWLVIAGILLLIIYTKFPEQTIIKKETVTAEAPSGFLQLIKERYFLLIFLSAALSMTVIYIADFGFLSSIKVQTQLFQVEGSVPRFLALVYGGLKIGELIISFYSSRLLSKYGVKLGLLVMPVTITLIIFIAAIVGFTGGVIGFVFLSLMILTKSMERILRRGLDDPAFNILYQPLPGNKKLAVQTKVGVVMQVAITIAGVLLLGLNAVLKQSSGFKLEYFPLFFLPILIAWFFTALSLYAAYKKKLREVLIELSKATQVPSKYQYGTEVLTKKFKKFNENIVNLSVTILSETNPRTLEPYTSTLLTNEDSVIKKAILRHIDPTWGTRTSRQIEKLLETETNKEVKEIAHNALKYLDLTDTAADENQAEELIKSEEFSDRIKVVKYLVKNSPKNADKLLSELFKDKNKTIKSSAIKLAVKFKSEDCLKELSQLLKSAEYYHISTSAILDIGEKALPYLEELFKETTERDTVLKIIEIYAKMGSKPARSLLVKQLNYPDRKVQFAVIWALYYCKYQAPPEEEEDVKDKIRQTVSSLLWVITAIRDIEDQKNTLKLFLALDQEKVDYFELLFNLLSFLHDPRVIGLIKKNIIGKNTIYALELIDNFVMQELKPLIVPVFDDISVNMKIKKLSKFFPQHKMSFNERLKSIIMLDFDKIGTWTLTKAVEMMGRIHKFKQETHITTAQRKQYQDIEIWKHENTEPVLNQIRRSDLPDEVFLCLFHTEELVYSTAARVIYDENPTECFDYLSNMSEQKQELKKIFLNEGYLLQDKVKLLRRFQLFFSIPDYLLVKIAELVRPKVLKPNEKIMFDYKNSDDIFILLRGVLSYKEGTEDEVIFSKKVIITRGLNIESNADHLIAVKATEVLIVNRYKYFNLLVDETDILQHIFEIIQ
jgi:hypothetical protein